MIQYQVLILNLVISVLLGVCIKGSLVQDDCYEGLGCFSQTYPWVSLTRPFPSPNDPKTINVTLLFFSRKNPNGEWFDVYPNIKFKSNGFIPNGKIVTITHGFASSAKADWMIQMKQKYLENENANIFLVNWEQGADYTSYFQAAANTRVTGAILGRFGKYLIKEKGVKHSDFHLIGHSLGAHISAYAGDIINNASTNGEKVFRITGLDPAQPGFQSLSEEVRLSPNKAQFVDVIHTDAKPFIPFFGFGYLSALGHVDIYLNRGYDQPLCVDLDPISNLTDITQLQNISVELISSAIACSHGRSYEIFTASIDKDVHCDFIGHRVITSIALITSNQNSCGVNGEDCIKLGLNMHNEKARGSFQLMTSGRKPYCCYDFSYITGCKASPNETASVWTSLYEFILG